MTKQKKWIGGLIALQLGITVSLWVGVPNEFVFWFIILVSAGLFVSYEFLRENFIWRQNRVSALVAIIMAALVMLHSGTLWGRIGRTGTAFFLYFAIFQIARKFRLRNKPGSPPPPQTPK